MIRRLRAGDEWVLRSAAEQLGKQVPDEEAARRFLADDRNLAFAALEDEDVQGFLYGYVLDRADGRRGAFLYDLEVGAAHRRRGLGRSLTDAFLAAAAEAGAYKAWVQTDEESEAARRTYAGAGAVLVGTDLVYGWEL